MQPMFLRPAGRRLAALALILGLAGCATGPLPVKVLNGQQSGQVQGFTEVSLASASFTTAALGNVTTGPNGSQQNVSRGGAAVSAAYASAFLASAPPQTGAPATTQPPPGGAAFDFKKTGDSAQAWATMTPAGMPFLTTTSLGKATASGTASWRARVTIPAGMTSLYVQFRMPAANVQGFTEVQGPALWQARVRAELQMNGHPVWMSETTRFSPPNGMPSSGDNCGNITGNGPYLQSYGVNLGFTGNGAASSSATPVTISLGSFPAGQTVEVSFVVRSDTLVSHPCCPHDMMNNKEFFCSRATASVGWDNTAIPVRFWVGPAV